MVRPKDSVREFFTESRDGTRIVCDFCGVHWSAKHTGPQRLRAHLQETSGKGIDPCNFNKVTEEIKAAFRRWRSTPEGRAVLEAEPLSGAAHVDAEVSISF